MRKLRANLQSYLLLISNDHANDDGNLLDLDLTQMFYLQLYSNMLKLLSIRTYP